MTDTKAVPTVSSSRHYPKPLWAAILLWRHLRDCRDYRRTGTTSHEARINIRRLFRLTNGRFNDVGARLQGLLHPPRRLPATGVLGHPTRHELSTIARDLRTDGIHRFRGRLPKDLCDRLHRFACVASCHVYPRRAGAQLVTYDPHDPQGTCYLVDDRTLHESRDVQRLAADLSLLSVAQSYLGCRPVFNGCSMWWSTAYRDEPDAEMAQLFHFDMDQIKFLKIFVYLTDVDEDRGPHVFVRGTHRRLPRVFLEDRRFRDEEILAHYGPERITTIAGPSGTFFSEDTRGLHKGTPVRKGHRLILQILYATSGMGGAPPPVVVNDRFCHELQETMRRYPRTYEAKFRRHDR